MKGIKPTRVMRQRQPPPVIPSPPLAPPSPRGYVEGGRGGENEAPRAVPTFGKRSVSRETSTRIYSPNDTFVGPPQTIDAVCSIALRLGHTIRVLHNLLESNLPDDPDDTGSHSSVLDGLAGASELLMNLWKETYQLRDE